MLNSYSTSENLVVLYQLIISPVKVVLFMLLRMRNKILGAKIYFPA